MTTKKNVILIIFFIIVALFVFFVRGVNQVNGVQYNADLSCILPLTNLKAYQDNTVIQLDYDNLSSLEGRNIWLGYEQYSQYINEDGLASEGFDWPTDHTLILIIQGRQTPNANGYKEIGQIEIYTSESVPNRYWVLGYDSLRTGTDANGNHYGIHPRIAFETDKLYGLIK